MNFPQVGVGISAVVVTLLTPVPAAAQSAIAPFLLPAPSSQTQAKAVKDADKALKAATTAKENADKPLPKELLVACHYFAENKAKSYRGQPPWSEALGKADVAATINAFAAANELDLSVAPGGQPNLTWAVGACAVLNQWQANQLAADTFDAHRALVEIEFGLSRLDQWRKALRREATDPVEVQAIERVSRARTDVDNLMREHDLLNRFSAALFAGTTRGSSGRMLRAPADLPAPSDDDSTGLSAAQIAQLRGLTDKDEAIAVQSATVETAHFGWRGESGLDGSFRARLANQPIQTVVGASINGIPTPAIPVVVLRSGVVASFGGRVGHPISRWDAEWSLVGQTGASFLPADKILLDDGDPPLAGRGLAATAPDRAAWFSEIGVEFNVFDNPIRVLHAEKGFVTPAFTVSAGYRHDSRYSNASFPDLDAGPHRFYLRAMIDAIKAISQRGVAEPSKSFDLGFGLEYDRPIGSRTGVPATARLVIRGELNLLAALGGGEKAKKTDEKK